MRPFLQVAAGAAVGVGITYVIGLCRFYGKWRNF